MSDGGITFEDLDAMLEELRCLPPYATSFMVSPGIEAVLRHGILYCSKAIEPDYRLRKLSQYVGIPVLTNEYLADDKCVITMSDGTVKIVDLTPEDLCAPS